MRINTAIELLKLCLNGLETGRNTQNGLPISARFSSHLVLLAFGAPFGPIDVEDIAH